MATILPFKIRGVRREREQRTDGTASIIIFPGVRYGRLEDEPKTADRAARKRRSKARQA